jgi:hypothetical protein
MLVVLVQADWNLDTQALCAGMAALEPGPEGAGDNREDDVR